MYEHNALGYQSGLALCLTKIRSSRARCPATALIVKFYYFNFIHLPVLHVIFYAFLTRMFRVNFLFYTESKI